SIVDRPGEKDDAITIKLRVADAVRRECDLERLSLEEPGAHRVIRRQIAAEGDLEAKLRFTDEDVPDFTWTVTKRNDDRRVGQWLWALCLSVLPELFAGDDGVPSLRTAVLPPPHLRLSHSVRAERPKDWAGYKTGGYWTARSTLGATFVKNVHCCEDEEMFSRAMRRGPMRQQHMAGVSALQ